MRKKFLLFFTCTLYVFITCNCNAYLPDISYIKNLNITNESPSDIKLFTNNINTIIEKLKLYITNLQKKDVDKKYSDLISNVVENIKVIYFQNNKLKSYSFPELYMDISVNPLGNPPYSLKIFNENINTLEKLNNYLATCTQKQKFYKNQLMSLKGDISSLLNQYILIKNAIKDKIPFYLKAYKTLLDILSLKIELVKIVLAQKSYETALERLENLKRIEEERVRKIFYHLLLSKELLAKIKKEKTIIEKESRSRIKELTEEANRLNKSIIWYEVKQGKIRSRLESQEISPEKQSLMQLEEQRLQGILHGLYYKKELLNQRKEAILLKIKKIDFSYTWTSMYNHMMSSKDPTQFLDVMNTLLRDVEGEYEDLLDDLDTTREKKIEVTQQIASLMSSLSSASLAEKKKINAVIKELTKDNGILDSLLVILLENKQVASHLKYRASILVELASNLQGFKAQIKEWGNDFFKRAFNLIKLIIFYPLISLGGSSLTLAMVGKIVILFLLGLWLLRLGRKRACLILEKKTKLTSGAINSITTLGYYTSLVILIFIVLSSGGVDLSQLSLLFGALGVGIGFGLQTIANNFISGLILLMDRSIKVGDFVELENGVMGIVKSVAIRATVIRSFDGQEIIVPNSEFVSNRVNTWTYSDDWRRLRIPFGVSYNADPHQVEAIAIEAAREVAYTVEDDDHPIKVWFEGLGDSSLNFSLRVWCRISRIDMIRTEPHSDYYYVLFKRLKEAGIEIPYPQRDINIKSLSQEVIKQLKEA